MRPASPCRSDGFNTLSVGFRSMSIQYTLPVRLRSAMRRIESQRLGLGNAGLCTLRFTVEPERDDRTVVRPGHLERIFDTARFELGQHLIARGARGGQRQVDPHSRPDLALRNALPRIIAAAAQRARGMRRLCDVAERADADAPLHIGQQARGRIAGLSCASRPPLVRHDPARHRHRPRAAPPAGLGGAASASRGRRARCAAASSRLRRCLVDPQKIARVGEREAQHDAFQNRHATPSVKRKLTSPDTNLCTRPAAFEQQRAVRIDTARRPRHCAVAGQQPAPRRPRSASSADQSSRKGAKPSALELPQHTQKLLQQEAPPARFREICLADSPRPPRRRARRSPRSRRRMPTDSETLSPTPMTTCAGPPASARSSIRTPPSFRSSNQISLGHLRPMPRAPACARARDIATPGRKAQGRARARRVAGRSTPSDRARLSPKARSSAARAARGPRAAVRSAHIRVSRGRRRQREQAGVGRIHLEQHLERSAAARRRSGSMRDADPPGIERVRRDPAGGNPVRPRPRSATPDARSRSTSSHTAGAIHSERPRQPHAANAAAPSASSSSSARWSTLLGSETAITFASGARSRTHARDVGAVRVDHEQLDRRCKKPAAARSAGSRTATTIDQNALRRPCSRVPRSR